MTTERTAARIAGESVDDVTAKAAVHVAERVLLMEPGDTLTIIRGEDGPAMFRIRPGHADPDDTACACGGLERHCQCEEVA